MHQPNNFDLPDRTKIIPSVNSSIVLAEPTEDVESRQDLRSIDPPRVYIPKAPKLWNMKRVTRNPRAAQMDRNIYEVSQWLQLRISPGATIDEPNTQEGKTWIDALERLAEWRLSPRNCIELSVHWGRVVEKERGERGEVVICCGLHSGHGLHAFIRSKEYAEFWGTITPHLAAPPEASYLCMNSWYTEGYVSITDVFFPRKLSDETKSKILDMIGRQDLVTRGKTAPKSNLIWSRRTWIEDDDLLWNGKEALGMRFVSRWSGAEGEAAWKQREPTIFDGRKRLAEERFWERLNGLGMLGFEEYHCEMSRRL